MKVKVAINGTDHNPYHKLGLKRNPFPQIPKAEYQAVNDLLNSLDADPIRSEGQLRDMLRGCSEEFIEACCKMYQPGKRVKFWITFPD